MIIFNWMWVAVIIIILLYLSLWINRKYNGEPVEEEE
jgi:hypothetical protein